MKLINLRSNVDPRPYDCDFMCSLKLFSSVISTLFGHWEHQRALATYYACYELIYDLVSACDCQKAGYDVQVH